MIFSLSALSEFDKQGRKKFAKTKFWVHFKNRLPKWISRSEDRIIMEMNN